MSGFLQRLLGHASDAPAGPVVRVLPAPAWSGAAFEPGVDAGAETAGSEEPGARNPDRALVLADAFPPDPDRNPARRDAPQLAHDTTASAQAAAAARMQNDRVASLMDGATAPQGLQIAVAGATAGLQSSTGDRARHTEAGSEAEGVPVQSIEAAGADGLLLPVPSTRRVEAERLSASQSLSRTDARTAQRNDVRNDPRRDPRASADDTAAPAPEHVVHVTIGRIDLVAQMPAARSRPAARAKATVPLSEYLRGTPGGRG